jgi:hypothetical protein
MGSTDQRRGAYGGDFSPTGLRLFAWWKKEGKKTIESSLTALWKSRLAETAGALFLFIGIPCLVVGARSLSCPSLHAVHASHGSAATIDHIEHVGLLVLVLVRAKRSWENVVGLGTHWPNRAKPECMHASVPSERWPLWSSEPGMLHDCCAFYFSFSLFISSK